MACCHKCGARLTRRRDGRRKCKRCGFSPNGSHPSRSGTLIMNEILTIHIERSEGGMFFTTCDQHRGLIIGENTLAGAIASVMPVLRDLLAAGLPHPNPRAFDGIDVNAEPDPTRAEPDLMRALAQLFTALYRGDVRLWTESAAEAGLTEPIEYGVWTVNPTERGRAALALVEKPPTP
jgi:hypothetical protein